MEGVVVVWGWWWSKGGEEEKGKEDGKKPRQRAVEGATPFLELPGGMAGIQ